MNYNNKQKKAWLETSNSSFCSMHKLKPQVKLGVIIVSVVVGLLIIGCFIYKIGTSRVSKNDELKEVLVTSGNSYLTISSLLKENNLIKSEILYKVYIKKSNLYLDHGLMENNI